MDRSKIEDCGDNLGLEKEKEGVGCHLGSGSRISTNRDRIRCFKCREYDHFANECINQRQLTVQIGIVIVQDQHLYIWPIATQDRIQIII